MHNFLGDLPKNTGAVLKYSINWAAWLGSDTLATSTFTVSAGMTKVSETNSSTVATVKVSGGTAGTSYTVTNTITTVTSGETEVATFTLGAE